MNDADLRRAIYEQAWFGADRRLPEWRRRTPDEIRELFDNLRLTGDFWRLA